MRAQKPVNDGSMDNITAFETVIHAQNALAPLVLAKCLRASLLKTYVRPAIVCVGSDRVAGDSLGPLTGSILQKCGADAFLYGTLGRTVTAREVPASSVVSETDAPRIPRSCRRRRRRERGRGRTREAFKRAALSRLGHEQAARMLRGCEHPRHRGAAGGRLCGARQGAARNGLPHGGGHRGGGPSRTGRKAGACREARAGKRSMLELLISCDF